MNIEVVKYVVKNTMFRRNQQNDFVQLNVKMSGRNLIQDSRTQNLMEIMCTANIAEINTLLANTD